jgi:hypothetical protein
LALVVAVLTLQEQMEVIHQLLGARWRLCSLLGLFPLEVVKERLVMELMELLAALVVEVLMGPDQVPLVQEEPGTHPLFLPLKAIMVETVKPVVVLSVVVAVAPVRLGQMVRFLEMVETEQRPP